MNSKPTAINLDGNNMPSNSNSGLDYSRKIAITVGGAALGLSGLADAGIVHYTGPSIGVVGETSSSAQWDIDGDGTGEFTLSGFSSTSTSSIFIQQNDVGDNLLKAGSGIAVLAIGDTVPGVGFTALPVSSTLVSGSASLVSPFSDGDNKIAFSFDDGANTLFGWANWYFSSANHGSVEITEWAYCDGNGCSTIDVGQTASVPEPALPSLLLLGMGAAGIARWKKGKKEASS